MFDYAVVEISGRQFKVKPGTSFQVNSLGDVATLECDKVLLLSENGELNIGTPYLKEKLTFEVLESKRLRKVRVAKYSAKANTRKVRGSRESVSVLKLMADNKREKKS